MSRFDQDFDIQLRDSLSQFMPEVEKKGLSDQAFIQKSLSAIAEKQRQKSIVKMSSFIGAALIGGGQIPWLILWESLAQTPISISVLAVAVIVSSMAHIHAMMQN